MAGAGSSSSSSGQSSFLHHFVQLQESLGGGFLCQTSCTGCNESFRFASWAAIASEDDEEKIAMKHVFQEVFRHGRGGIPRGSLVDVDVGGEDSHLIDDFAGYIGVADGVGDESLEGQSGIYSRFLLYNVKKLVLSRSKECFEDPFRLLCEARDASERGLLGRSTALLLRLLPAAKDQINQEDGIERTRVIGANVGDTCAILIRPGKGVIGEAPRQHRGKAPHQLPEQPQGLVTRDEYQFEWVVQDKDIVVAGSDGLFDNVYQAEIYAKVQHLLSASDVSPKEFSKRAAEELQRLARQKSFNEEMPPEAEARAMLNLEKPFLTPHITEAFKDLVQRRKVKKGISFKEADELGCWGGKSDDITVVVSTVVFGTSCDYSPPGLTKFERGEVLQ